MAKRWKEQLKSQRRQWKWRGMKFGLRAVSSIFDTNQLAAPVEAKTNAPWLKKFREGGVEVVRKIEIGEGQKTGSAPLATPEDVERGVFADNVETYRKLTGRAARVGPPRLQY